MNQWKRTSVWIVLILLFRLITEPLAQSEAMMKTETIKNLVLVPEGEFIMGLSEQEALQVVKDFYPPTVTVSERTFFVEVPDHKMKVHAFRISKFEVTNEEFKKFVNEGGYERKEFWKELITTPNMNTDFMGMDRIQLFKDTTGKFGPSTWINGNYPEGKGDEPVQGVSWYEAHAFCRFLKLRLPSEAEWEYAARGSDQRRFPWGNESSVASKWTEGEMKTLPVGSHPEDRSPMGVMDMANNVWEWVFEAWYPYPDSPLGQMEKADNTFGIMRGGTYQSSWAEMRTTSRRRMDRLDRRPMNGFRCAADAAL